MNLSNQKVALFSFRTPTIQKDFIFFYFYGNLHYHTYVHSFSDKSSKYFYSKILGDLL